MKTWKKYCAGLALSAGLTPAAWAQIPAAPPGAAVGVGGPAAAVGVGGAPPLITADLAKPADSAEGAAARIEADEAGAAARKAAIRKLATVDCHYWPEAQDALVNALRGDRNECVRYEAALALNTGCCCTKKVLAALTIVISGSDEDGNPAETSQ